MGEFVNYLVIYLIFDFKCYVYVQEGFDKFLFSD